MSKMGHIIGGKSRLQSLLSSLGTAALLLGAVGCGSVAIAQDEPAGSGVVAEVAPDELVPDELAPDEPVPDQPVPDQPAQANPIQGPNPNAALPILPASAGVEVADWVAENTQVHVRCTQNLRAVYATPISERRLIGGAFIDAAQGEDTRAACEQLAAQDRTPHHLLWAALARLADGDVMGGRAALLSIPRQGTANDSAEGRAEPGVRAQELLAALGQETAALASAGYLNALFVPQTQDAEALLTLSDQGLVTPAMAIGSLRALQNRTGNEALIEVFSGTRALGPDQELFGPDLAELRALADAASQTDDPLSAIIWLKRASTFYRRGFEQQGLEADLPAATKRLEDAFNLGWRTWFQIERPEAYRDNVITQVLPLAASLRDRSEDGDFLHFLAQAIAMDWGGLSSVQELYSLDLVDRAAALGSAKAQAQLVIDSVIREEVTAEDAALELQPLAAQDPCLYDIWGQAHLGAAFTGAPDKLRAQTVFRQGQAVGASGAFVGEAELHRWGHLDSGYNFTLASDLFTKATQSDDTPSCGIGAMAAAHLNLGWLNFTGQIGKIDLDAARMHFRRAVNLGDFSAAEALSDMYLFGLGVPQDPVLAHDYAVKAYLWNKLRHQTYLAYDFHKDLGAELRGFSVLEPDDLRLISKAEAVDVFADGAKVGSFFGTYHLGLALMLEPERADKFGGFDGVELLRTLGGHVGAFERGLAATDQLVQTSSFKAMGDELVGQLNLAFTPARYDTHAALYHDPARALAFYQALGAEHPTVAKLLNLDRWAYLSASAKDLLGSGPVTLQQVIDLGLGADLGPLPLTALMTP